jgi:hypothetical protein
MFRPKAYHLLVLAIAMSVSVNGCVISTEPLLGPDSRVLPFTPPMSFEVYERDSEHGAWRRKENVTLVADKQLVVRDDRHQNDRGLTFHPHGPGQFLVQANFHSHYGYGVLEVHNREGILKSLDCAKIDQMAFRAAGGTVIRQETPPFQCNLDTASKPLELLASIAAHTSGVQFRYVPMPTAGIAQSQERPDEGMSQLPIPEMLAEIYGPYSSVNNCWLSKRDDGAYCIKLIKAESVSFAGDRRTFITTGGQKLDDHGEPLECHACLGVLGLIVVSAENNGRVLARNSLFEDAKTYGRVPKPIDVSVRRLGPGGSYGWIVKMDEDHGGTEVRWLNIYGVIGDAVVRLGSIVSKYSNHLDCAERYAACTNISVELLIDSQSPNYRFIQQC